MDAADPSRIHTLSDLKRELDLLRRAAARPLCKHQLSVQDLVVRVRKERGSEVPRSTLHRYLSGAALAPAEIYEAILRALDVGDSDLRAWADAWDRLDDARRAPSTEEHASEEPAVLPQKSRPRQKYLMIGALAAVALLAVAAVVVISIVPNEQPIAATISVDGNSASDCPGEQVICLWETPEPSGKDGRFGPTKPSWGLTQYILPRSPMRSGFNNSNQNQRVWSDIDQERHCTGSHEVWYHNTPLPNVPWPIRCINHT